MHKPDTGPGGFSIQMVTVAESSKKRVLLVDDNSAVRTLIRRLFEVEPDFEVSGEADTGQEGVDKARVLKPDLIIMDLSMPVMSGLDAALLLKTFLPGARMILFTVHEGEEVYRIAREAGIHAVVPKAQAATHLVTQSRILFEASDEESRVAELRDAS